MIRLAKKEDLPRILEIYQIAREFMIENGNETQWGKNFPPQEILEQDIEKEQLFVVTKNEVEILNNGEILKTESIHGVFAFIIGEDETYQKIENGEWHCSQKYGTVHRLAGDGIENGIFEQCINFCKQQISYVRIDTHENNKKMQYLIKKYGFKRCGIIYVKDGSARIAYDWLQTEEQKK